MEISNVEYLPLIECKGQNKKYYIVFHDVKCNLSKIELTKKIFLQMFGVHKIEIKDNEKRYLIEYKDEVDRCQIQLSLKEFREFNSFKSQDIKYKNIYNRYIEHSEQSEEIIQKQMIQKTERIEDIVYRNVMRKEIQTHYYL